MLGENHTVPKRISEQLPLYLRVGLLTVLLFQLQTGISNVIEFPDSQLEYAVKRALEIHPDNEITHEELLELTELDASYDTCAIESHESIRSLEGLQYA